ncbi:EthD family reductase [Priestia megaterium]|uniref:EthD family reductase n=1 Tax=Priestia megaterium TaxID=1404 RepID=UPI002E201947|nr:EthD family reductase [Priestia megaterium]MED3855485.1 EthD family reductase [Priestia megaterium]
MCNTIARIAILRKKEELSIDIFGKQYLEVHGPIVTKIPGLRRYEQYHVVESTQPTGLGDEDYPRSSEPVDGFSKLWFDGLSSMETALKSDVMKVLGEDILYGFTCVNQIFCFTIHWFLLKCYSSNYFKHKKIILVT